MKTLLLDIETAPNTVHTWGFYDQNVAAAQVLETSYVLCWSAKWLGNSKVLFSSIKKTTRKKMMAEMHKLLNEADVVVSYNGQKFDLPTLNKEFIQLGFAPPAPYKQIDCLREVRRIFRFQSNKLDFVSQALGLGSKREHEGFTLWTKCMDAKHPDHRGAWRRMEAYNRQDVKLLEDLYVKMRPWIAKHPNMGNGHLACPRCTSTKLQQRGWSVTLTQKYLRYQCQDCGGWLRDTKGVAHRRGAHSIG